MALKILSHLGDLLVVGSLGGGVLFGVLGDIDVVLGDFSVTTGEKKGEF